MKHIEYNVNSNNILSSYGVLLSKVVSYDSVSESINTSNLRHIGLIAGLSWGDGRPVVQQGELGSKTLFTLINEGQKSLSFQRLIPFPDTIAGPNDSSSIKISMPGSILSTLYREELIEELGGADVLPILAIDIEQYDSFRRPIQLVLTFKDEMDTTNTIVWLKNASVAGSTMNFVAGSQYAGEPTQLSWEDTIPQPI